MPYGYRDDEWREAKAAARRVLVARAAVRKTVTYAELASSALGPIEFSPDDPVLGKLLGEVSTDEDVAGHGMLSAVVVRRHGIGLPSTGFFVLAARLGRDVGDDRRAFWESELARVFAAANSRQ